MIIKMFDSYCTDTLRHRETARKIVEKIPQETKEVTIDFENVDFVSRSFLHELLCGLVDKKVNFVNSNDEIDQMKKIVQKRSVLLRC